MYTLYKGGRTQRQTVNNGGWGNMKYYSQPPSPSLDLPCAPPSWICVSDLSRKSSNYTKLVTFVRMTQEVVWNGHSVIHSLQQCQDSLLQQSQWM